jgi:sigma-B regulation protein RsbU (phosphoserine phosphatase)
MKIILVDDDSTSRMILAKKLRKLEHEVSEASDGNEAWFSYRLQQPRIVISDLVMPNCDGLELCRRIRQANSPKYTYIIMLTAQSGKVNYHEAMDAGADDFLTKPCDMDDIIIRLRVAERLLQLTTKVNQLEGLLPICSYCKRIRDEEKEWRPVEQYINDRSEASFSHGVCPTCYETHVKPQLQKRSEGKHADGSVSFPIS